MVSLESLWNLLLDKAKISIFSKVDQLYLLLYWVTYVLCYSTYLSRIHWLCRSHIPLPVIDSVPLSRNVHSCRRSSLLILKLRPKAGRVEFENKTVIQLNLLRFHHIYLLCVSVQWISDIHALNDSLPSQIWPIFNKCFVP